MSETILITGATGTVGSEVVKQLVSSSPDMTVYSNLVKEIRKYDSSINHIVKLSSMAADDDEEIGLATTIGRIHREEEKIIEESGIPFTLLRPPAFMQNFITQFGYTIRTRNAFYVPAGDAKLSFIDARDVSAVAVKALTGDSQQHMGKAYAITAQEAISYGQAAEILSNEVGRRISYIDIPEEDAQKGMKNNGMDDWLVDAIMEFYSIIKSGHASKTTNVFEEVMGRKPITFSQFARDYAQAFK